MDSRLGRRLAAYLVVALVAWAAWTAFVTLTLPKKYGEGMSEALARGERIDIVVELGFKPEKVHMSVFQQYGSVVGVSDDEVTILRVDADRVDDLARYYWIDRVRIAGG